ncbi:DUF3533 domain-containing protein [Streptomyces sp. TRM 70351]|uniref:DUF3533 domain-containing protein n=1 Tax=Streptomyces sp. TRM 70351 TaxID=3116552 RepID=UPI002E7C143E|nr:DUF3533 domain-containing protein [Streptomyces sp. TRM 70351]MEE1930119.1 DUF3533 domain-containing protein [Streptomyces sp. TRM 70351]
MAGSHAKADGGFLGELRDAVSLRAAALVLGVLALQLGFVASYVGAFHDPAPHRAPVAVVAPEELRDELVADIEALPGDPVDVTTETDDVQAARRQVEQRETAGALVMDPAGGTDTLLVAGGGGTALAQALEEVFTRVGREQDRSLTVEDVVPADDGDARGLTSFYLVVGWCVGGYLCAAILAMSYGARPATTARAFARLGTLALYALAAGAGGAVVVGPVLGALPGGLLPLSALGALVVFAVGAATLALQGIAGVVGIGLAIALVVVLGNPSAGGAFPGPLLPPFWRTIGPFLPPGAGTWATRSLAYFDGAAVTGPLLVLGGWAVAGAVLAMLSAVVRSRRARKRARGGARPHART